MNQKRCKRLRKLARNNSCAESNSTFNDRGAIRNSANSVRGIYRVLKTVARG